MPRKARRPPETPEQLELGQYLRTLREYAGRTTYEMSYSNSTISEVENGIKFPSMTLLLEYATFCHGDPEREKELDRLHWAAVKARREFKGKIVNIEQSSAKRRMLLESYRRLMREISAEIRGVSKYSRTLIEELDERTARRFIEENELYRAFLKDIRLPRDWLDVLAPKEEDR